MNKDTQDKIREILQKLYRDELNITSQTQIKLERENINQALTALTKIIEEGEKFDI